MNADKWWSTIEQWLHWAGKNEENRAYCTLQVNFKFTIISLPVGRQTHCWGYRERHDGAGWFWGSWHHRWLQMGRPQIEQAAPLARRKRQTLGLTPHSVSLAGLTRIRIFSPSCPFKHLPLIPGKLWSKSANDLKYGILLVSQFTLYAKCKKVYIIVSIIILFCYYIIILRVHNESVVCIWPWRLHLIWTLEGHPGSKINQGFQNIQCACDYAQVVLTLFWFMIVSHNRTFAMATARYMHPIFNWLFNWSFNHFLYNPK